MIAELGDKKSLADVFRIDFLEIPLSQVDAGIGKAVKRALGAVDIAPVILGVDVAFHPGPGDIGIHRDVVFGLASLDAEAAADALRGIDQKGPVDFRIIRQHLLRVNKCQGRERDRGSGDDYDTIFDKISPVHCFLSSSLGLCGLWHRTHSKPGLCSLGSMPGMRLRSLVV